MKKAVIDLTAKEAQDFFLEGESYCSIDLPEYFNFNKFLNGVSKFNTGFDILGAQNDTTSYIIYNNKDGKHAWRKLQLIHPILYLKLVDLITDNWNLIQDHFKNNKVFKIDCCPIFTRNSKHKKQKKTQILAYLEDIEKNSIKKSLEFKYMSKIDIADCYPSVYTHSIAWALHTKPVCKNNRTHSYQKQKSKKPILLGNDMDFILRSMQNGQTNGIPQGSVLMDFVAEIILTHIDKLVGDKLLSENITEYKIIRYRDDYRIFTKEKNDNEKIIKILSEILIEFNFKLNTNKTEIGEDITLMSIKKDKLNNIVYNVGTDGDMDPYKLKRLLLDILNISKNYPNSGFILRMLQHFNERGFYENKKDWYQNEIDLLITVLLNIVTNNPRCFSVICVSIFNLLPKVQQSQKKYFVDTIYKNLLSINNIGYNEIWLQRSLYKVNKTKKYTDSICKVVSSEKKKSIFGNHFITKPKLKLLMDKNNFINRGKLSKIPTIPKPKEVKIFSNYSG